MILVGRPELYEAMYGEDAKPDVQNLNFVEVTDHQGRVMSTLDSDEEFRQLVKARELLTQNQVLVKQGPSFFDSESDDEFAEYPDDENPIIIERR